jgi:hypothetical protein
MTYRDLFFWLGADAEAVWLEALQVMGIPERADLTDPQADE